MIINKFILKIIIELIIVFSIPEFYHSAQYGGLEISKSF